ncbi:pyruvyl transferase [Bacillus mojavensis]|uniref:polysaccharide pyruvyl transferase family protein n=1 Tax=Bacillus mojavensis TaxID=72360 RepID=UPI0002880B91|nr:polysaccharide pyruvyl transferase family protein [Bacillus mojavensis]MDR4227989.1 pyruvyl transferase [Bacillus mojavensis]MEC1624009.1 polysaccharide pyruvyl transferase family protein [Bacillus mojavensis]MEC1667181.1 polysaccharide pyruvyl transferase family protein [Bacillus mojavensis]MEC3589900.1 polysaccharide pyruvyl transferase family protein [Bacillus mojavensis]MEC5242970.1 polysaccharide pyruvyl transferase family protein [Bacillus mojavensis]
MSLHSLKINLAEWLLLKVKYPSQFLLGAADQPVKAAAHKKKIILTLLPSHDNLGDHAIAYASKAFLEQEYSDFEIVEVDMKDIYKSAKALIRSRHPEDMVFIIGGGNMGDLYRYEEWTRRFIIKTFHDYQIVQLPATVHFSDTKKGRKELERAQKIYNAHPGLLLMARDETTYQFMKRHFKEKKILKQPDMVLYLDRSNASAEREGVYICLREDQESVLQEEQRNRVKAALFDEFGEIKAFTTTVGRRVSRDTREQELEALWSKLQSAEAVVTDRLHGMIFCALTGTPCVVIRSFDHKVMEGYQWLKEVPMMKLIEQPEPERVTAAVKELLTKETNRAGFPRDMYFKGLRDKISGEAR